MKETEITVQIFDDENVIDEKLKEKGYFVSRKFKLFDWYFTKYDNVQNMEYADLIKSSFLIRYIEDENGKNSHVCYKVKEFDKNGNVIGEEKIKTNIDNLEGAIRIFKNAQLNNWCELKNYSKVYKNNEGLEIAMQSIENLGCFFEIEEDEEISNLTSEEKFAILSNRVKDFGLNIGKDFSCKKPYIMLKNSIK